jgi:serine/threonine protein phosphatase PrpC
MSIQNTNLGWILTSCRRGASHCQNDIPCQDAYAVDTKTVADKTCLAIAVADGHGDEQHDLSEHGAKIAVRLAIKELIAFFNHFYCQENSLSLLNNNFRRHFPRHIGRLWRHAVLQDAAEQRSIPMPSDDIYKVIRRYGTTLLVALILPDRLLLGQIGDGDMLRLYPNGHIETPLLQDNELIANSTYSLSSPQAYKLWQTATVARMAGETLLLATDGLSNAFVDDTEFHTFARSLLKRISEFGIKSVDAALGDWLDDYSERSTGDDITLLIFNELCTISPVKNYANSSTVMASV